MTLGATVNPDTASSNISMWLARLHITPPSILRSPEADVILRCGAVALLLVVAAYWVRRWWAGRQTFERREVFSIEEASDIISRQEGTPFRKHKRKYEVTNELLNLVNDGRIPLANEKPDQGLRVRSLAKGDMRQFPKKNAAPTDHLARDTLIAVAKGRNWKLPTD